jgi:hypothetical protein
MTALADSATGPRPTLGRRARIGNACMPTTLPSVGARGKPRKPQCRPCPSMATLDAKREHRAVLPCRVTARGRAIRSNVAFTRGRKRAKLAVARRVQCGVGQAGIAGRLMNEGSLLAAHRRTLTAMLDASQRRCPCTARTKPNRWPRWVVRRPPEDGRPARALARTASQATPAQTTAARPAQRRQRDTRGTRCKQRALLCGRDAADRSHALLGALLARSP